MRSRNYFPFLMQLAFIISLLWPPYLAFAQRNEAITNTHAQQITVDPQELERFADEFFAGQMAERHIPGLTFVAVQKGQPLVAKGYGLADMEKQISFAENTVVRIGSVSKLFVATAVMQLVEQGKLDMHTNVNQYLTTFQIDDNFPTPVTLAHLLTHTGGFEDPRYRSNTDPASVQPLGPYLAEYMPPRASPPGQVFCYSNHAYALAAYVVEQVSGIPFDQYVEENILHPLGMERSGYLLSPPMPAGLGVGYSYEDGTHIPQPIDYDSDYPGGSLISTAADMAKFMLAHLRDGCYQDRCILQPATIADMHQQQATTPYDGQNVTYGFVEGIKNDQRLIGHSGAIRGFGSILDLLPKHNLGYFFSFSLECLDSSACEIIPKFREQFLDRFFPSEPRDLWQAKGPAMVLTVYLMSALLLLVAAFATFRVFVRCDYQRKGRLTPFSMCIETVIFFLWGGFPYIYSPSDWPAVHVGPLLKVTGWVSLALGLAIMFTAMAALGLRRSLGQEANVLKQSGFYRVSRNPQILGCALYGIGFAVLWPSWYALGWVVLFVAIAHTMILTEEEHLRDVHGEEYVRYCERVPRYVVSSR